MSASPATTEIDTISEASAVTFPDTIPDVAVLADIVLEGAACSVTLPDTIPDVAVLADIVLEDAAEETADESMVQALESSIDSPLDFRFRYWLEESLPFMLRTYASFRYKHARCRGEERIKWDFSHFLDEESQFTHALQWIYDYLTNERGVFKIGLTFQPLERCVHDDYGYFTLGYSRVTFVCCDENPHTICRLEERLIDQFRYWGPKGSVFDPKKCARCMNRAIGGLSGLHGSSPFFVYIATRSWISTYRP